MRLEYPTFTRRTEISVRIPCFYQIECAIFATDFSGNKKRIGIEFYQLYKMIACGRTKNYFSLNRYLVRGRAIAQIFSIPTLTENIQEAVLLADTVVYYRKAKDSILKKRIFRAIDQNLS